MKTSILKQPRIGVCLGRAISRPSSTAFTSKKELASESIRVKKTRRTQSKAKVLCVVAAYFVT